MDMNIIIPQTEKQLDGKTAAHLENSIHSSLYRILDSNNDVFATSGTGIYDDPARKELLRVIAYIENDDRTFIQMVKRINKGANTILKLREDKHYEDLGYTLQFLIAVVIEQVTPDDQKRMPRDSDYS